MLVSELQPSNTVFMHPGITLGSSPCDAGGQPCNLIATQECRHRCVPDVRGRQVSKAMVSCVRAVSVSRSSTAHSMNLMYQSSPSVLPLESDLSYAHIIAGGWPAAAGCCTGDCSCLAGGSCGDLQLHGSCCAVGARVWQHGSVRHCRPQVSPSPTLMSNCIASAVSVQKSCTHSTQCLNRGRPRHALCFNSHRTCHACANLDCVEDSKVSHELVG